MRIKVHGYTEEKDRVRVSMTIDEIVEAGIDPWQVDLFDPNPLVKEVQGEKLFFKRMTDVSFAYKRGLDAPGIVAMHNGEHGVCFVGEVRGGNSQEFRLESFKPSEQPFQAHLREYLEIGGRDERSDQGRARIGFFRFAARPASAVKIQASAIVFDRREEQLVRTESYPLVGEMFREMPTPVAVPPEISYLFENLAGIPFVIGGDAPRKMLIREPIIEVQIVVPHNDAWDKLDGRLAALGIEWQKLVVVGRDKSFNIGNCRYSVRSNPYPNHTDLNIIGRSWQNTYDTHLSIGGLYCLRSGQLEGATRIKVFDVAKRQARAICAWGFQSLRQNDRICRELRGKVKAAGFKIIRARRSSTCASFIIKDKSAGR